MSKNIKPEDLWEKPTKEFESRVMASIDSINEPKKDVEETKKSNIKYVSLLLAAVFLGALWVTATSSDKTQTLTSTTETTSNDEVETLIYAAVMESSDLYDDYIDSDF